MYRKCLKPQVENYSKKDNDENTQISKILKSILSNTCMESGENMIKTISYISSFLPFQNFNKDSSELI